MNKIREIQISIAIMLGGIAISGIVPLVLLILMKLHVI